MVLYYIEQMEDAMKRFILSILLVLLSGMLMIVEAYACDNILKVERQSLDRWKNGDVYGFIENAADGISYFDPTMVRRLDGKEAFIAYLQPTHKKFTIPRYEIINPQILCFGNVGVLSFNLANYDNEGKITSRWNSSETYQKKNGSWKMVHSHWSVTEALKNEE